MYPYHEALLAFRRLKETWRRIEAVHANLREHGYRREADVELNQLQGQWDAAHREFAAAAAKFSALVFRSQSTKVLGRLNGA